MIGDKVSLVVLTFNRRAELLRTLSRLADIDAGVPIVVVDNASTDGTAEALARLGPRMRIVRLSRNAGAAGRNAGVRACTTPYVAFCDDDTWWLPESIAVAAAALDAHPALAAVTARVLVGERQREDPTNAVMAASPFPNSLGVRGSELLGLLAGACMVRRAAFLEAGGYHPRLFLGREEALLAIDLMTAGWHMAYVPDAVVRHFPSSARDSAGRSRISTRNALWIAWLRRPTGAAWHATRRWWADSRRNRVAMRNAVDALRGLPWVLRERRVVPARVEMALQTLDALQKANPTVRTRHARTSRMRRA
ncbi:MAG TPA: glycosyltransferase [Casimicrobiaceae bacterium]|nr:glycosyltransferase [Casimicrobiaceae bacterium]